MLVTVNMRQDMTQIQEAGEEKQLFLKPRAHSFYTNISHYVNLIKHRK